jgi:Importin, protein involved in nuclear import
MVCKKWASQIVYRFFSRYHDYKAELGGSSIIGKVFTASWVQIFLDIIVSQVFSHESKFIPDVVLNYYIKYINQAIKYPIACEYLKTLKIDSEFVIPLLITKVITPLVKKTPHDQEL